MADVSEKAAENFNKGTESKKSAGQLVNVIKNSKGKVLSVNVISNGDTEQTESTLHPVGAD